MSTNNYYASCDRLMLYKPIARGSLGFEDKERSTKRLLTGRFAITVA